MFKSLFTDFSKNQLKLESITSIERLEPAELRKGLEALMSGPLKSQMLGVTLNACVTEGRTDFLLSKQTMAELLNLVFPDRYLDAAGKPSGKHVNAKAFDEFKAQFLSCGYANVVRKGTSFEDGKNPADRRATWVRLVHPEIVALIESRLGTDGILKHQEHFAKVASKKSPNTNNNHNLNSKTNTKNNTNKATESESFGQIRAEESIRIGETCQSPESNLKSSSVTVAETETRIIISEPFIWRPDSTESFLPGWLERKTTEQESERLSHIESRPYINSRIIRSVRSLNAVDFEAQPESAAEVPLDTVHKRNSFLKGLQNMSDENAARRYLALLVEAADVLPEEVMSRLY